MSDAAYSYRGFEQSGDDRAGRGTGLRCPLEEPFYLNGGAIASFTS